MENLKKHLGYITDSKAALELVGIQVLVYLCKPPGGTIAQCVIWFLCVRSGRPDPQAGGGCPRDPSYKHGAASC